MEQLYRLKNAGIIRNLMIKHWIKQIKIGLECMKKPRKKKAELKKSKGELMLATKQYVYKRDKDICQKCMKKVFGSNRQASHVIPVSHGNVVAFDELNMKVLCNNCHKRWWHLNPIDASEWFKKKFPERHQHIMSKKNDIVKWKVQDYQKKLERIQRMTDELEEDYEEI